MSLPRVDLPPDRTSRSWPRQQQFVAKLLKLLGVLFLASSSSACAGLASAKAGDDRMSELRAENDRLEAELLELRESYLSKQRHQGCPAIPSQGEGETPTESVPEPDGELPVVKLAPEPLEGGDDPVERDFNASVRLFHEDERSGESQETRPVLKVRGQSEAWVYHRRLDEAERTEAALVPVSPSGKRPTQSP